MNLGTQIPCKQNEKSRLSGLGTKNQENRKTKTTLIATLNLHQDMTIKTMLEDIFLALFAPKIILHEESRIVKQVSRFPLQSSFTSPKASGQYPLQ